jgi:hypothetical protein
LEARSTPLPIHRLTSVTSPSQPPAGYLLILFVPTIRIWSELLLNLSTARWVESFLLLAKSVFVQQNKLFFLQHGQDKTTASASEEEEEEKEALAKQKRSQLR